MLIQFSRLAVSLVVARWVGPDSFGVWNALNLILLYGPLVTLGVANGMNRDVPVYRGRRDYETADKIIEVSYGFVLASTAIAGLGISAIAMTDLVDATYHSSLLVMGFLFFSWGMYQFFQLLLKSSISFRLMSVQQIIFAVLLPAVSLPLAYFLDVPGFILGQAIVALIMVIVIARLATYKIPISWDRDLFISLVKVGFPIMAAGLLYRLLTSVDRWVILTFLSVEELGQYTLAILAVSVLGLLPSVIGQQIYPRMAYRYGETHDKKALKPLIVRQSAMAMIVTLPILAIVFITLPYIVDIFLPEYALGVPPARILLLGLAFIPLAGGFANFLNTVNKQVYYLAVQAAALIVNLALNMVFIRLGYGLNGVALAAATTYFLYTCALVITAYFVYKFE